MRTAGCFPAPGQTTRLFPPRIFPSSFPPPPKSSLSALFPPSKSDSFASFPPSSCSLDCCCSWCLYSLELASNSIKIMKIAFCRGFSYGLSCLDSTFLNCSGWAKSLQISSTYCWEHSRDSFWWWAFPKWNELRVDPAGLFEAFPWRCFSVHSSSARLLGCIFLKLFSEFWLLCLHKQKDNFEHRTRAERSSSCRGCTLNSKYPTFGCISGFPKFTEPSYAAFLH